MGRNSEILLVEDDSNDVVLLQYAFEKANLQVSMVTVENGKDALEYLGATGRYNNRETWPLPRIVLLDLNLPLMQGLEVLTWLNSRPELASLPVLVLSSSCDRRDVDESRRRGAQAFLVKPISNQERLRLVHYLQDYWLAEKKPRKEPPPGDFVKFVAGPRRIK